MIFFENLKDFDFFSFGLCYFGISTFHNKIATVQFKIISFLCKTAHCAVSVCPIFIVKEPNVKFRMVHFHNEIATVKFHIVQFLCKIVHCVVSVCQLFIIWDQQFWHKRADMLLLRNKSGKRIFNSW